MRQIRTIAGAAEEIKRADPDTAITEYRIRQMVNENSIPFTSVGNRKLIDMQDIWSYFSKNHRVS